LVADAPCVASAENCCTPLLNISNGAFQSVGTLKLELNAEIYDINVLVTSCWVSTNIAKTLCEQVMALSTIGWRKLVWETPDALSALLPW